MHYRIDDIDFNLNPASCFTTAKGQKVTYIDYYQTQYGKEIKCLTQPLLVSRPKRIDERKTSKINSSLRLMLPYFSFKGDPDRLLCLIPEFCYMTGLSEENRKDHTKMKVLSQYIHPTPGQRSLAIQKFLSRVKNSPECTELLDSWGLELADASVSIQGRKIDPVKLLFGNNKS